MTRFSYLLSAFALITGSLTAVTVWGAAKYGPASALWVALPILIFAALVWRIFVVRRMAYHLQAFLAVMALLNILAIGYFQPEWVGIALHFLGVDPALLDKIHGKDTKYVLTLFCGTLLAMLGLFLAADKAPWVFALLPGEMKQPKALKLKRFRKNYLRILGAATKESAIQKIRLIPRDARVVAYPTERERVRRIYGKQIDQYILRQTKLDIVAIGGESGSGKTAVSTRILRRLCLQAEDRAILPVFLDFLYFDSREEINPDTVRQLAKDTAEKRIGPHAKQALEAILDTMPNLTRIFYLVAGLDSIGFVDEGVYNRFARFIRLDGRKSQGIIACSRPELLGLQKGMAYVELKPFSEPQKRKALNREVSGAATIAQVRIKKLYKADLPLATLLDNPYLLRLASDYLASPNASSTISARAILKLHFDSRCRTAQSLKKNREEQRFTTREIKKALTELARALGPLRESTATEPSAEPTLEMAKVRMPAKMAAFLQDAGFIALPDGATGRYRFRRVLLRNYLFLQSEEEGEQFDLRVERVGRADGSWRECLALYTALADPDEQERVADAVLAQLQGANPADNSLSAGEKREWTTLLRFLGRVFGGRSQRVKADEGFQQVLRGCLQSEKSRLVEFGAEHLHLLSEPTRTEALRKLLRHSAQSIQSAALAAMRYVNRWPEDVVACIGRHVLSLPRGRLLRYFNDFNFHLSLRPEIAHYRRLLKFYFAQAVALPFVAAALVGSLVRLLFSADSEYLVASRGAVFVGLGAVSPFVYLFWRGSYRKSWDDLHLLAGTSTVVIFIMEVWRISSGHPARLGWTTVGILLTLFFLVTVRLNYHGNNIALRQRFLQGEQAGHLKQAIVFSLPPTAVALISVFLLADREAVSSVLIPFDLARNIGKGVFFAGLLYSPIALLPLGKDAYHYRGVRPTDRRKVTCVHHQDVVATLKYFQTAFFRRQYLRMLQSHGVQVREKSSLPDELAEDQTLSDLYSQVLVES